VLAWRNYGMVLEGWAVSSTRPKDGISFMQEGLAELGLLKTTLHVPYLTSLLTQVCGRVGDFQSASALCIAARVKAQSSEQYIWEAELHRIEGEMRRAGGQPLTDVEGCFGKALDVSRRQGARMLELRAATSLARAWCDQGKLRDARNLLGPVYSWFTQGFDASDLKEARGLLDMLR
jgi:predicted ATPase